MRVNHYLRKNAYSETANNILVVDTEARIENRDKRQYQTFRLGYAIHLMRKDDSWVESSFELHSIDDFWKLLDRVAYQKKKLYVVAHNMAYDYAILKLDSYISSRRLEIKMRVIETVFMIRAGNILFMSSTNFYRKSLKELGKIFGFQKYDTPSFEETSDSELMRYCARDAEVLSVIIRSHLAFIKENDLGCFKPTIAGQAFTTYRHRFMNHQLLVHAYPEILQLEKESYRGGRCEVFKMGKHDDITCLDINSMYPFVMKVRDYPTMLVSTKIVTDSSVQDLKDAIDSDLFVLANCDLEMTKPLIACKREKLIFPVGKIRQSITSPEIEYILTHPDCGKIVRVNSRVTYSKARIFSEYVDYFYHLRMTTSNQAYQEMSKLMLNSLYGKMGQRISTLPKLVTKDNMIQKYSSMMDETRTHEIFTGANSKFVRIGSDIYFVERNDSEYSRDSIPIIASAVTSYARVLLFELIEKAGRENVLYCDTDSLFVNEIGLKNLESLISQSELGKLKIEKSGSVEIRGCKDYTFNGVTKLKGIKKDAEKLPDGRFRQFNFQTKNSRYRAGTPDGIVILEPIVKSLSGEYTKGNVSGGLVTPFAFSEF